jgi:uncharacterized protein with NRDE domain
MCLILLSYKKHVRYPLVFASNRDEFYERPSAPVAFWDDAPDVLAGRDMKDGGTWMGITRKGRIAALTNYRDPMSVRNDAPSRGWLVRDFLCGEQDPESYLEGVAAKADQYNAFSLIVGDLSRLLYFSNRGPGHSIELPPGLYGLSNHLLNTPWTKVEWGKTALSSLLDREEKPDTEDIFKILMDQSRPDDSQLPDTGAGLEWERIVSPIFITSPVYGTRSSLILMIDRRGHAQLIERNYNSHPEPWMTTKYEFRIQKD